MIEARKFSILISLLAAVFALSGPHKVLAQKPFECAGQIYAFLPLTDEISEITIDRNNNALTYKTIAIIPGKCLNVLGFRSTDRMLYGIDSLSRHIIRIDANGQYEDLEISGLDQNMIYQAGEITPDGNFFVVVGSAGGIDRSIVKIDLESPGFPVESISAIGNTLFSDVSFNPVSGSLYGYDANSNRMATINIDNGQSELLLTPISNFNDFEGPYFNAFGDLRAYGSTASGVSSAIFGIDVITGAEQTKNTGPETLVNDITACPYSVEIQLVADPKKLFPCSELTYQYRIANASGITLTNVDFEANLPPGFTFLNTVNNPFGGTQNIGALPQTLRIEGLTLPKDVRTLEILVEIDDIPSGRHKSMAILNNLPADLGGSRVSDDPATLKDRDSTSVEIVRIEADSLFFSSFLCLGETITLNATEYGNNVIWSTGSTDPVLTVAEGGQYRVEASSGCQSVVVIYNVIAASCPFTIELEHVIEPEETLPCHEVLFSFNINNESGVAHRGLKFIDTLPEGMKFLEFVADPLKGSLLQGLPDGIVQIQGVEIPVGQSNLEFYVEVGNVYPGIYENRAIITGLPVEIGPMRISDNPLTQENDATPMTVLGVGLDTLVLEEKICDGGIVVLDGSPYGVDFLWEDGSTDSRLSVDQEGIFQLKVFDGCEPTFVFFSVSRGEPIEVSFFPDFIEMRLGDTIQLFPEIMNEDDILEVFWKDPFGSSLTCETCQTPLASPKQSGIYQISVSNGTCQDSAFLQVRVDNQRILYLPNIFSPNGDGVNDYFYIHSPDFGLIRSLQIVNRWGVIVFHSNQSFLNDRESGWNGLFNARPVETGVYLWMAEIEFADGLTEVFTGEISLVR